MKLSIVITASGSQSDIDDTLVSVLENRPSNCEILLAHPEHYQDPYQLADEVRLITASSAGKLALLNAGIAAARGELVHTLFAGTMVSSDWCDQALDIFDDDATIGSVSPGVLSKHSSCPVLGVDYQVGSGKRLIRRVNQNVLAPQLGAGFFLRRALQFMHGFDEQFGYWADVELGLRMNSAKYRCTVVENSKLRINHEANEAPSGFQAGRIRGRLFRQAKAFGLVRSQAFAVLTEPFRHSWGPTMISGLFGRIASLQENSTRRRNVERSDSDYRNRHAA